MSNVYTELRDARKRIAELEAQAALLRDALEFYANPAIYKPHPHGPAFDDRDLSFKAKAVLVLATAHAADGESP
jgi:hypothetical protein